MKTKNKLTIVTMIFLFLSVTLFSKIISSPKKLKYFYKIAETKLLPKKFPVFSKNGTVVNNNKSGGKKNFIPTVNKFKKYPGCYIACYAHNPSGVYSVGGGIYVMGQVRVPGKYKKRICNPKGAENKDISAMQKYKNLCNRSIPKCNETGCWAGGDTGGWFGIQSNGNINSNCAK